MSEASLSQEEVMNICPIDFNNHQNVWQDGKFHHIQVAAWTDIHGDRLIELFVVDTPAETTIEEYLSDFGICETRCHHEYDCCGNLYGNKPEIIGKMDNGKHLVKFEQYRNV